MNACIVINATALGSSGALTILKQFIDNVPNDNFNYIVFVNEGVSYSLNQANLKLMHKDVKSLVKRFYWDMFGLKKWLKVNKIKPVATISLQNTNFRTGETVPNFIYYHQSIPFYKKRWNPVVRDQRTLWFYSKIYPFFVNLMINKDTEIFVQSRVIQDSFASFFNFPKDKIHVIFPTIELPVYNEELLPFLDKTQLNLFYPATPFIYKNHSIILKALSILEKGMQNKITLHLTCEKSELMKLVDCSNTNFNINFLGNIPFNKIVGMYKNADALLFPSFIETFGLPLIEAASFGMPIIVADLPYSREVLIAYEGAFFVSFDNYAGWSQQILKLFFIKGLRYSPIKIEKSNSWHTLFKILKSKLQ
jgi:glycosyltransferase involved in cell wall biosynthesis